MKKNLVVVIVVLVYVANHVQKYVEKRNAIIIMKKLSLYFSVKKMKRIVDLFN